MTTHSQTTSRSPLLLAVDAGGTKTLATIAEPGPGRCFCLRGVGRAGPGNPLSSGLEPAMREIVSAIEQALEAAETPRESLAAAVIAVAGAARQEVRQPLELWAAEQNLASKIEFVADWAPVLAVCEAESPAVGVIAGTGSVVVARNAVGQVFQHGGWGYLLGDEGSGYAIGRAAIRQVLEQNESGRPIGELGEEICAAVGAQDPGELVRRVYDAPDARRLVAAVAPCVIAAMTPAEGPSRVSARQIVEPQLLELARIVQRTVAAAGLGEARFPLSLAGGILTSRRQVRDTFLKLLSEVGVIPCEVIVLTHPTDGCLRLAHRLLDA